jgi:glycosyltransferase involved in cell wall biosynthesis
MSGPSKRPKIAFVSTMAGSPWGGSEELWARTATYLHQRGLDVGMSVYGWPDRPPQVQALLDSGVAADFRPLELSVPMRIVEKVLKRFSPTPIPRGSVHWLKEWKPDLVVISQGGPWDGLGWMRACRDLGLNYCPIVHANSEIWWPEDAWRDDIVGGLPAARRVFFVSKANRRLMEVQCGFSLENAEIVINPCNVSVDHAVPWPEDDVTRIACVGRVDPKAKGQDLLLRMLAMPKWRERPVELNIYGGGPCLKSLEAFKETHGLSNVIFAGHENDVSRIWARNHALVLPSRFEGLPLVIVEAMLCGRPVITTDIAGNAEYLEEGVTGFVAQAPTVDLLDDAMERAWARRGDWKSIGLAARESIVAKLPKDPIQVFADKLVKIAG